MNLPEAAEAGNIRRVRELLAAGANPDDFDTGSHTALHHAAVQGNRAMTQVLLEARATVTSGTRKGSRR